MKSVSTDCLSYVHPSGTMGFVEMLKMDFFPYQ